MTSLEILVTGGAGFMGSEFVRQSVAHKLKVSVVDTLTYAGDLKRLDGVYKQIKFYKTDICNAAALVKMFKNHHFDAIVHFAAETHVDRSILGSGPFIKSNITGTQMLLDIARDFKIKRFIHVSTDEVYGDVLKGRSSEQAPIRASSPYSASKAAAELLVQSYMRTFDFPAIIVRPSNNYGPWQYPEKFIPVVIFKALHDQKVPIYAQGLNQREWLYVSDCADAILRVLKKGRVKESYNIGGAACRRNIDVAKTILDSLGKPYGLLSFVKDRPGHDLRYALDSGKIYRQLGWRPKVSFDKGIQETVRWYQDNAAWCQKKVAVLKKYWSKVYVSN